MGSNSKQKRPTVSFLRSLCQPLRFSYPILYWTVQGVPVICAEAEFIVWRETMKYDTLNQ